MAVADILPREWTPETTEDYIKYKGFPHLVISVLGPPGVGKTTICEHLHKKYDLMPFSARGTVQVWVRSNEDHPNAHNTIEILQRNERFSGQAIHEHLHEAIMKNQKEGKRGTVLDGYPETEDQIKEAFNKENFEDSIPFLFIKDPDRNIPDLVLYLASSEDEARERFLQREGDTVANRTRFQWLYKRWLDEDLCCVHFYVQKGLMSEIDADGTFEETTAQVEEAIQRSGLLPQTTNGVTHH